jgi:hypothetical protein
MNDMQKKLHEFLCCLDLKKKKDTRLKRMIQKRLLRFVEWSVFSTVSSFFPSWGNTDSKCSDQIISWQYSAEIVDLYIADIILNSSPTMLLAVLMRPDYFSVYNLTKYSFFEKIFVMVVWNLNSRLLYSPKLKKN